jgi:uncharacterized protein YjbI with pentapeptide repeats
MADHNSGWDWEKCTDSGCIGVRLPTGDKCWAHAAHSDLDPALERLGDYGGLDARGVPITQELLGRLLAAVPQDDRSHPILTNARFNRATFQGVAGFNGATFQGRAEFLGVAFQDGAWFHGGTIFQGGAWFHGAIFQRAAGFHGGVTFQGDARFHGTTFEGLAAFEGASFQRVAGFPGATFKGRAVFHGATFQGVAWFHRAIFQHDAEFSGANFKGDAWFDEATFQQAQQLGPILVRKSLRLDQAIFHERAQIQVAAAAVCCQHARFPAGVQLRVRWAQVVLDDADPADPSILTGAPAFQGLEEGRWARALVRLQATSTDVSRPRLASVRRADVAGMTVAGVDLRACRFAGAHHLDQLRIEESDFAPSPMGWQWTTRQTIALVSPGPSGASMAQGRAAFACADRRALSRAAQRPRGQQRRAWCGRLLLRRDGDAPPRLHEAQGGAMGPVPLLAALRLCLARQPILGLAAWRPRRFECPPGGTGPRAACHSS